LDQWMEQKVPSRPITKTSNENPKNLILEPTVEMTSLTTRIICHAAFEYEASDDEIQQFLHHIAVALREYAGRQLFDPFRRNIYGFLMPEGRQARKSALWIRAFAQTMLDSFREKQHQESRNEESSTTEKSSRIAVKSVIKLIVENPNLSEKQRVGEIIVFLLAGYDTTGYTLSNALVALAENPLVAQKLRKELLQAERQVQQEWATKDKSNNSHESERSDLLEEAWRNCAYAQNFIRENFRFCPVAAFGSLRCLKHDLEVPLSQISVGKTINGATTDSMDNQKNETFGVIPAGAQIIMPQMVMNRNEAVFPQASVFDPERWTNATPAAP